MAFRVNLSHSRLNSNLDSRHFRSLAAETAEVDSLSNFADIMDRIELP
jgi:hypothetical protein